MTELGLVERARGRLRRDVLEPLEHRVRAPLRRHWNAGRVYRPIFVAGASGSGTSLLAVSLGQRFDCAGVVYESGLQMSPRSPLYVPPIETFASVADYERRLAPDPAWDVDEARRDLLAMYRAYAWGPSDVVIDKNPNASLLRVAFHARCFSDARFALVFRDPVANLEGLRRKWSPFSEEGLEESIRFYRACHERFLAESEPLGERAVVVEYESLVRDPDAILARLGAALDLAPARRARKLRSYPNVEGRGLRNVHRSRIGVVQDASEQARKRLPAGDVARIEAALEPLHRRLRELSVKAGTREGR